MDDMEIPFSETKLVIRLTRSLYGSAFYKNKGPFFEYAGSDGFRVDIPEKTPEDVEDTDMAITLFIKERLIPVAEQTTALVVVADNSCSLASAFAPPRAGGDAARRIPPSAPPASLPPRRRRRPAGRERARAYAVTARRRRAAPCTPPCWRRRAPPTRAPHAEPCTRAAAGAPRRHRSAPR